MKFDENTEAIKKGNGMMAGLCGRDFGFRELLKVSWHIFARNFIYVFLSVVVSMYILRGLDYVAGKLISWSLVDRMMAAWLTNIFTSFFGFVASVAVISIVGMDLSGRRVTWTSILSVVKKYFWPAFFVNLIMQLLSVLMWGPGVLFRYFQVSSVVSGFPVFLCGLISIIFNVYFSFATQSLLFRKRYGVDAFMYSFNVIRGYWWKVFRLILLMILVLAPVWIGWFAFVRIFHMNAMVASYWISPFLSLIGGFGFIFFTVLFFNMDRVPVAEPEPADSLIEGCSS